MILSLTRREGARESACAGAHAGAREGARESACKISWEDGQQGACVGRM